MHSVVRSQFPDRVPAPQTDPLFEASWVTMYLQCSPGMPGPIVGSSIVLVVLSHDRARGS